MAIDSHRFPRSVPIHRLPTLDGWRAVAVCLVIAAHASPMLQQTAAGQLALRLVSHAGFGVDVFFALSGFLISTLLLREKAATGGINLPAFFARRVFRIIPPILVYLCAVLLLLPLTWLELLGSLFFFRNYVEGSWYTGHFWSLAVEEHFYVVIPWLFLVLSWSASLRVGLFAAACCIVVRWVEWMLLEGKVEFRTEARFDGLLFGAALALFMHRYPLRERLTWPLAGGVLVIATAVLIALPAMPVRRTVVALALPVLIGYTVLHPHELVGRVLEWPALRWIGRLSYSLYIWQMLFFVPVRDLPAVQAFPVAIIGTVLCAVASYYLVEKPLIAVGHRLSDRLRTSQPASSRFGITVL